MIISTTNTIQGRDIKDYLGVVNANIVLGTNFFSDWVAALSDVWGGTSGTYKKKLDLIYQKAMEEIQEKATALHADAVVGLSIDFDEVSGGGKSMFMVSASGTAVTFWNKNEDRYEMYKALAQIYDFKQKGILTDDEYEFEKKHITEIYSNRIHAELVAFKDEKALAELREREEMERKALALKTAEQIMNEKFTDFMGASNVTEEHILTASYDDIDYDESDDKDLIIARFIRLKRFPEACRYYMDETGLEDIPSAIDYCIDIRNQIQNIDQEKLASLINKMKVLKKRGFIDQAMNEYKTLTLSDSITAKEFIESLDVE